VGEAQDGLGAPGGGGNGARKTREWTGEGLNKGFTCVLRVELEDTEWVRGSARAQRGGAAGAARNDSNERET
jgi:hypothetical protein